MDATRFASYVEELQEFSASYGLQYGSPQHLNALVATLQQEGTFRGECTSMVRSVIYRQHGDALPADLLTLVAIAWGGPQVLEATGSLQQPLDFLLEFLRTVIRPAGEEPEPLKKVAPIEVEDPIPLLEYSTRRTVGVFENATAIFRATPLPTQPADSADRHEEIKVSPLGDIDEAIQFLESRSSDVKLYRDLQQQRDDLQPDTTGIEIIFPDVQVVPSPVVPPVDDPWDEQSDLQKDLRAFAKQRSQQQKIRDAAYRKYQESRSFKNRVRHAAGIVFAHLPGMHHVLPHGK